MGAERDVRPVTVRLSELDAMTPREADGWFLAALVGADSERMETLRLMWQGYQRRRGERVETEAPRLSVRDADLAAVQLRARQYGASRGNVRDKSRVERLALKGAGDGR